VEVSGSDKRTSLLHRAVKVLRNSSLSLKNEEIGLKFRHWRHDS